MIYSTLPFIYKGRRNGGNKWGVGIALAKYRVFFLTGTPLINSQSLEDTQVGYISQKYTLDKYTLEK